MTNPFKSKNFWANIINIVVVFLIGAGVVIPDNSANDAVSAFVSMNPFIIGALLLSNFILPIIKTVRNKTGDWRASLFSTNFWGQVITLVLWILSIYVPDIPADTATQLVDSFFSRNYTEMLGILFVNIILPVIHLFLKPKVSAG